MHALSKPHVGQHALQHRRHQAEQIVGLLARAPLFVAGAMRDVALAARSTAPARAPPR
jgi:hypothetical protein